MGTIGYGYGSEWHLLRYLGYHRSYLNDQVMELIGAHSMEWLDFGFSEVNDPLHYDKEVKGLEFIQDTDVQKKWQRFWPQTGNSQNWDAIGKANINGETEWLLVEAKAHVQELNSNCGAKNYSSLNKIRNALKETIETIGDISKPTDYWLTPYYQYANRLAVLYFLMHKCSPAVNSRLLFIYFYGDYHEGAICPQSAEEWQSNIQVMKAHLGIDERSQLNQRVHYLFLPVNPQTS